jgi:hypothetical protein
MKIRKILVSLDTTVIEGEKEVTEPWTVATAAALIANPYVGVYQHDLNPLVEEYCKPLSDLLIAEIRKATGWNLTQCEALGKAAGIGLDGEIEHGSAIIHNRKFGNTGREAVNGTAPMVGAELRIPAGATLWIPMKHKNDHLIRSHHMCTSITVLDGPRANEIMIAIAVAQGSRPLSRLSDPKADRT